MRLLDTDILIDIYRRHAPATAWVSSLRDEPVISGLTAFEMLQGCQNMRDVTAAHECLAIFTIVWPSEADFEQALSVYGKWHLQYGCGFLDVLIGHQALRLGATLCTFNHKHYRPFDRLRVEAPYARAQGSGS